MIGAFAEAIRATTQPCTLLLVLPPLVATILTRGRWIPLGASLVAAVLGGWLYAANVFALNAAQLQASGVIVAGVLMVTAGAPHVERLRWCSTPSAQAALSASITFAATLWWRPCVGSQLGALLTDASRSVPSALPGMTAYMLGAMAPVVLAALLIRAVEPGPGASVWMVRGAGVVGLVVASSMAMGTHDQLVSTLTRWTLS